MRSTYKKAPVKSIMADDKPSFGMMRIPLIISGLFYFGFAGLMYAFRDFFSSDSELPAGFYVGLALFCFALGAATIIFAFLIHKKSKVVYVIAFIITVMYIPSLFVFFGVPMLLFLLKKDVRVYYGIDL